MLQHPCADQTGNQHNRHSGNCKSFHGTLRRRRQRWANCDPYGASFECESNLRNITPLKNIFTELAALLLVRGAESCTIRSRIQAASHKTVGPGVEWCEYVGHLAADLPEARLRTQAWRFRLKILRCNQGSS